MPATPATLRVFTGLPAEVPEALLREHVGRAERQLARDAALSAAPPGMDAEWDEAVHWAAFSSLVPFLHTFSLSGAAKAGRLLGLDGAVEFRFLGPEDQERLREWAMASYRDLVSVLRASPAAGADSLDAGFWLGAV